MKTARRIAAMLAAIVFCAAASAQLCLAADAPAQINDFLKNYIEDGDPAAALDFCGDKCYTEDIDCFGFCGPYYSYTAIDDVKNCAPAPGAPCTVTARLKNINESDSEETIKIFPFLIYSVNDGESKTIAMTDKTGGLWSADIPPQPAGAKVDYTIRVFDEYGNVTTGALPTTPDRIRLMRLIKDSDNSADVVLDDMDILETSAGYDNEYLYIKFTVQGRISGGTLTPPYIELYGLNFAPPNTEIALMTGILWIYLPLLPEVYDLLPDKTKAVIELPEEDVAWARENKSFVVDIEKATEKKALKDSVTRSRPDAFVEKSVFLGRIRRADVRATGADYIQLNILSAANASTDSFMPIPLDVSPSLVIKFDRHSYVAK